MKRSIRWLAAVAVLLFLPVQGIAAACAQVCMKGQLQAAATAQHDGHCHDEGDGGKGNPGSAGKCCFAHVFMMEDAPAATPAAPPAFEGLIFVARWTSYIPEEPSRPPIASAA